MGRRPPVHVETLGELSAALAAVVNLILERSPQLGLAPGSVVVLIQQRGSRRSAAGWFEANRWQHRHGYAAHHEITVAAETVTAAGPAGVAATVAHELVHLVCFLRGIRDTSRGGRYHNKEYKTAAQALGLAVEWLEGEGFAATTLGPPLAAAIRHRGLLPARLFKLQRLAGHGDRAAQRRSWTCGCRSRTGRALTVAVWKERQLRAQCLDCGERFMTATSSGPLEPG